MERSALLRLFLALADEGVAYLLVWGVAVKLHGLVRATEGVDLALLERMRRRHAEPTDPGSRGGAR